MVRPTVRFPGSGLREPCRRGQAGPAPTSTASASSISATVLIHLMPDQVPVHFNAANEPDRASGKYELLVALLFPLCGVFIVMGSKGSDADRQETALRVELRGLELFVFAWILFFLTSAPLRRRALPQPTWTRVAGPPSSAARSAIVAGNFMPRQIATPSSACTCAVGEASRNVAP